MSASAIVCLRKDGADVQNTRHHDAFIIFTAFPRANTRLVTIYDARAR